MARIQMLKTLVNERLHAAAAEIFGAFEKTITHYEEEIDRQRQLLNLALHSEKLNICTTDPLELISCEEKVPTEQEKWSLDLDQVDPEPPQIKEEQNHLWTTQGGEQLHEPEEADVTEITFPLVPVKSEHDEEGALCSQVSQRPIEDNGEGDPLPSTSTGQTELELEGEDSDGVLESARNFDPTHDLELSGDGQLLSSHYSETHSRYSGDDWREPQSSSNSLKSKTQHVKGHSLSLGKTFHRSRDHKLKASNQSSYAVSCQMCGNKFPTKLSLMGHVRVHPMGCGLCGKHLEPTESLKNHLLGHRTCNFCGKIFASINNCVEHVRTHTGEKPFSCTVCGKRFCLKGNLKQHMTSHTCEKPFTCTFCSKSFSSKPVLMRHMRSHTGEKPFGCAFCGRGFSLRDQLKAHMKMHTGEKPWSCSGCGNRFPSASHLSKHKCCSVAPSEAGGSEEQSCFLW